VEEMFVAIVPTRRKLGPTTQPGSWPAWWALFPASWRSPLTSSHGLFYFPKNDMRKFLCPFDVQKVPESQKHAKTSKSTFQCENQIKGDCFENLQIQWKTCPNV
jgi:hypothetical protein